MEYRILGRTGLRVSVMGLGCGGHSRLGLRLEKGEDNAVGVVRRALDLGVNFIDTAEAYGTEGVVGRALSEANARGSVVISTKVSPKQGNVRRTAAQVTEAVENGLRRLQTEYIDVLHLHGVSADDYSYCTAELVPVLRDLQSAGKIRFIGITEAFGPDPQHKMLAHALQDDCWDVMMVGFNLLNQSARERVFAQTQSQNIGVLDMFAVRRALQTPEALHPLLDDLAAQYNRDRAAFDGQNGEPLGFLWEGENPPARHLPDAAYRFCRDEPGVHVVLSGTGNTAHLEENAASLSRPPLPFEVTERLRSLFAGIDSVSGN